VWPVSLVFTYVPPGHFTRLVRLFPRFWGVRSSINTVHLGWCHHLRLTQNIYLGWCPHLRQYICSSSDLSRAHTRRARSVPYNHCVYFTATDYHHMSVNQTSNKRVLSVEYGEFVCSNDHDDTANKRQTNEERAAAERTLNRLKALMRGEPGSRGCWTWKGGYVAHDALGNILLTRFGEHSSFGTS